MASKLNETYEKLRVLREKVRELLRAGDTLAEVAEGVVVDDETREWATEAWDKVADEVRVLVGP